MQALLSFDKAPPFAAPLRFFLSGPLFIVAAGVLLALGGNEALASRWLPSLLAIVHLLTVGFMLQVMLGALIQVMPVVAGANLADPLAVARPVHLGLNLGAALLAWGLYTSEPLQLQISALILLSTAGFFLWHAGRALYAVPTTSPTIRGLKLSLFGLAGALILGGLLVGALARGWALPAAPLADLHAAWGLGAWGGILLAAVAFVVVPMFQLTPGYPARPSWWLPPLALAACLLWALALWLDSPWLLAFARLALFLPALLFAAYTLHLQRQRRRARPDATYRYWQLALTCTIFAVFLASTAGFWPALAERQESALLVGILLLPGAFVAFIAGMLYKIVPFLAWFHLQNIGRGKTTVPPMNRLLADDEMQRQFHVHALAVGLLLVAVFLPAFVLTAGAVLALSGAWLGVNLTRAVLAFRREHAAILRVVEGA
jgi:hypothetical protein